MGERFSVRADLRRAVIFGRHDLIGMRRFPGGFPYVPQHADVLQCRNAKPYLDPFPLCASVRLFVSWESRNAAYPCEPVCPIDLKRRIFTKVANVDPSGPRAIKSETVMKKWLTIMRATCATRSRALNRPTCANCPRFRGTLVLANERARVMLLGTDDLGRPLRGS